MHVVRLDLAYDGSGFSGFARQSGSRTIQGELEAAIEKVLGVRVSTTCSGRTDRSVHARHQVVTFEVEELPDLRRLRRSLDGVLGGEVAVRSAEEAPPGFDARFSATSRTYRYFAATGETQDPLRRTWTWHVGRPLDIEAMNQAAAGLVGEHDFASFCRRREGATTLREVLAAGWSSGEDLVTFEVTARAFCHQMVRSMVGLCVDVGLGRVPAGEVTAIIAARTRGAIGTVAPPHGLVLWEVRFG